MPGQIDGDLIWDTVTSLAAAVRSEYMDPQTAVRVDATRRQWLAEERYAGAASPEALGSMLTRDLFALTRDKHLSVCGCDRSRAWANTRNRPYRIQGDDRAPVQFRYPARRDPAGERRLHPHHLVLPAV